MNISQWDYYEKAAQKISERAMRDTGKRNDWQKERPRLLSEFFESMGLTKLPDYRTTEFEDHGRIKGDGFQLQKISWQILPDCWNCAGIYRPDPMPDKLLPAILYTSGHSGNATYRAQAHAIMWARRGYICMIFDTIEQNDNPGDHHGLCHDRRPDWVSMGYSGAGGELWNSIRALDILETLPGVDSGRIGVTGSSGGGAHSFFLTIADERIKAVATSCGVVRPRYQMEHQHLPTHCDCMFYHNLYARDPIEFTALIAPRPLLYCFAIEDYLFSVEQYKELFAGTRAIYRSFGCEQNCELFDYHGPHGYQPESIERIQQWFDQHLCGEQQLRVPLAEMEIPENQTSVFNGAPPPENRLAQLPELLSSNGAVALPQGPDDWPSIRDAARKTIRDRLMMNFDKTTRLELVKLGDWMKGQGRLHGKYTAAYGENEIWVETLVPAGCSDKILIGIADTSEYARDIIMRLSDASDHTVAVIVPRFCGFNACTTQSGLLLRAGACTGMTSFMLMLEDLQLVMPALLNLPEARDKQPFLYGRNDAGVCALYQTILDDAVQGVVLDDIPDSHRNGAYFLNVLKYMDIKHATGLAAPRRLLLINYKSSLLWTKRLYDRLNCSQNMVTCNSIVEAIKSIS